MSHPMFVDSHWVQVNFLFLMVVWNFCSLCKLQDYAKCTYVKQNLLNEEWGVHLLDEQGMHNFADEILPAMEVFMWAQILNISDGWFICSPIRPLPWLKQKSILFAGLFLLHNDGTRNAPPSTVETVSRHASPPDSKLPTLEETLNFTKIPIPLILYRWGDVTWYFTKCDLTSGTSKIDVRCVWISLKFFWERGRCASAEGRSDSIQRYSILSESLPWIVFFLLRNRLSGKSSSMRLE